MAELLIKAVDHTHADPDKDRAGCYKKGDIVVAMPDGHKWGVLEGPPKFVRVVVPDLDVDTAMGRAQSWDYEYDVQILQRDVSLDGWRFKVVCLTRKSDGTASPRTELLRKFFEAWSATFVRLDADGVVLDWWIVDGATSLAFLGHDPTAVGLVIAETNYDQGTGVHTYSVDFSAATFDRPLDRMRHHIERLDGRVLSSGPFTATYELPRDAVKDAFVERIKQARMEYKRRRYSFSAADVDTALVAGGVLTLTAAQVLSRLIDARAE